LYFHSASSLKQQFTDRHVAPFGHIILLNRIGGVIVSVLASSVVDHRFDRSGQTNDYKIGICCFSAKHASSLKQQFTDRHVAPFGHIILIPSQPVFALSP
jgi:hypothetical protein